MDSIELAGEYRPTVEALAAILTNQATILMFLRDEVDNREQRRSLARQIECSRILAKDLSRMSTKWEWVI